MPENPPPAYEIGQRVLATTPHRWDRRPEVGTVARRRQLPNSVWQYDITFPGCCTWEYVYERQLEPDPLTEAFHA